MHTRRSALPLSSCALLTALIAVCAQLYFPLPGVPVNMALFAVELSGMLLGPVRAMAAVAAYLLLGACGAPVFSGFSSGPSVLFGPTGGFLLGYLFCALITGSLSRRFGSSSPRLFFCGLAGVLACMACGAAWLIHYAAISPTLSGFAFFLLYLPGDLLKLVLAAYLSKRLEKPLRSMGLLPS